MAYGDAAKKVDPYEQGMEASMNQKNPSDNPYQEGTAGHQEWIEGHEAGEESWQALCAEEVAAGRPKPTT